MENFEWNINLDFDIKLHKDNVIKVIGVGGAGGNAVNYMYQKGIKDVDFVVINTDAQDLAKSPIPIKVQIGRNITEGLGAGAIPETGKKAAEEDLESIRKVLEDNTKMIFITAGMGGGTGTGAAPVVAKLAKEMGILTVGIVTSPFGFEGKKRLNYAEEGIENLRQNVDSLIIINNNKLREIFGNLTYSDAFSRSDEILAKAATSISEVITHNYKVNVDFRDVRTVLEDSGTAIMGSAVTSGENRARNVIEQALDSPLLNDNKITGAKNILLLIVSGKTDYTLDEMDEITHYVQQETGGTADIILGIGKDEKMEEEIGVTIIATGFPKDQQDLIANTKPDKIVHRITKDNDIIKIQDNHKENEDVFDTEDVVTEEKETSTYKQPELFFYEDEKDEKEEIIKNINKPLSFEEEEKEKFNLKPNSFIEKSFIDEETETNNDKPKIVHKLSEIKEEKNEQNEKTESEINQEFDESALKKKISFIKKEKNEDKQINETFDESKYEDIEDITELPFEIALKLSKKRKKKLMELSDDNFFTNNIEKEMPAYEKRGINPDISPKSEETTQRINIDRQGNIQISDSNSFFRGVVD